jgi:hypothetical protein
MFDNGLVREALDQIRGMASGLVRTPAWSLPDAELVPCLDAVHEAEQALAVIRLHLIREVERRGVPAAEGATGIAVWLRGRLGVLSIGTRGCHAVRHAARGDLRAAEPAHR